MTSSSGWWPQLKKLKLSDSDCTMRGSSGSDYVTASAAGSEHGCASSSYLLAESASGGGGTGSGESSGRARVEEQIERSKSHWSLLADQSDGLSDHDEVAEESNVEVFQNLQRHPAWGEFFWSFGGDGMSEEYGGELRVGEKFAEGGQAELFLAHVTWRNPKYNERDLENGREWVVKVFKKGTFLRHLQRQLPLGYLQFHADEWKNLKSPTPKRFPRFYCDVMRGTLLKDGRFAFLMEKEHFDLRTLIERNMVLKSGRECGPFSKEDAELVMYQVAMGVDWLHGRDIVHRDLKASNVLVCEWESGWPKWWCYVADYECSVGVVGTGFFRAPEILQACKEGNVSKNKVFSKAVDVYSYGMTCYEILIGKLPFGDHIGNAFDVVLEGGRLEIPYYVEDWTHQLLSRCWECNPDARPTILEILDLLVANSAVAREALESLHTRYGKNFRVLY